MRAHIALAAFLAGFAALMATACSSLPPSAGVTYDAELDIWIGRSTSELKVAWGRPTEVIPLDNGVTALLYMQRLPMGTRKGTCITTFELNADAAIVKHYSQGTACEARPKIKPR